ncbi:MAG: carboxypeptidase-like regulatory domain-containing protein, partial [Bacteroidetes bacterium]|nr:carboxypeptidase-like regulatory domain-containing protein [Bacteroidota bacterium]
MIKLLQINYFPHVLHPLAILRSKWALLSLLISLPISTLIAQDSQSVQGTVLDESGSPLPGANIILENTTEGTVSDIDGNFTLQAPAGQVLIIRMVGMETTKVTVSKTGTLQVTLKEATSFLNPVVITGFQEVDRKLFTGAS